MTTNIVETSENRTISAVPRGQLEGKANALKRSRDSM